MFIIASTILCIGCSSKKHIGEWKGTNRGHQISLILDNTNHAVIIMDNKAWGGKEFVQEGKTLECKYEIDYSINPMSLDFVIYDKADGLEMDRIKTTIKFITDTKIEYTTLDGTMILDKQSK